MQAVLEHFHFLRPWFFLLLIPLAYALYHWRTNIASMQSWKKVCDPELLAYLQVGTAEKPASSSLWKLVSAALIGLLSIIAIAGPAWQQLPQP
ncbi:MAG: hypothetical protein R8M45_09295, partial [Ghiorsea sp.]